MSLLTLSPAETSIARIVTIVRQAVQYLNQGVIPVANGGTGSATATANTLFAGPTTGAAAAPAFRALAAADLPAGTTPVAATKAQQQTGTDNADFVSPLHQQDHNSAAKAWAFCNAAGAILDSYNVRPRIAQFANLLFSRRNSPRQRFASGF